MPTHTIHGALTSMYGNDEAPWLFPAWMERTGVKNGLFPRDDAQLPEGITREEATLVQSWFITYLKLPTEAKRVQAASAKTTNIGRDIWRKWLTPRWKAWDIQGTISNCLVEQKLHPLQIALAAKNSPATSSRNVHSKNHPLNIPIESNLLLQLVVDSAALTLLGPEAFDEDTDRVLLHLRAPFTVLVQRCWLNNKSTIVRDLARMSKYEVQATEAFESEFICVYIPPSTNVHLGLDKEQPTKARIRGVIRKVALWRNLAKVHCHRENLELIEDMEEELKRLMNAMGADLKVKVKGGKPRKGT